MIGAKHMKIAHFDTIFIDLLDGTYEDYSPTRVLRISMVRVGYIKTPKASRQ